MRNATRFERSFAKVKNERYWSPIHYEKAKQAFERDVFPIIGRLPVADIALAAVSQVVTKILARGVAETASKILQATRAARRRSSTQDKRPSPSGKRAYVGRETIEKLYADALELAGNLSLHGWRAAFSTLARDAGWARDVVELSLDHIHDSATVRAYDRGERKTERIKLAQWWDAQLNPPPAGVVPIATAKQHEQPHVQDEAAPTPPRAVRPAIRFHRDQS